MIFIGHTPNVEKHMLFRFPQNAGKVYIHILKKNNTFYRSKRVQSVLCPNGIKLDKYSKIIGKYENTTN